MTVPVLMACPIAKTQVPRHVVRQLMFFSIASILITIMDDDRVYLMHLSLEVVDNFPKAVILALSAP